MKKIIVATHGGLSKGLIDALHLIIGNDALKVETYSLLPGGSADDYAREIKDRVIEEKDKQFVILVDLYGASVCNAMLHLSKLSNVFVISGVNLGMLLEVVLFAEERFTEEDIEKIICSTKERISRIQHEEFNDENEF